MNVGHSAVCVWEQSLEVPSLDLCMCVCVSSSAMAVHAPTRGSVLQY